MKELAVISDYPQLVAALRLRCEQLDIANSTIDEVAGLPSGYAGKVLTGNPRPRRVFGMISLGLVLDTLCLRLVLVEDEAAMERLRPRLVKKSHAGAKRQLGPVEQQPIPVR